MKTICEHKTKVVLPGQVDKGPHWLGVLQVGLELLEILLPVAHRGLATDLFQTPHVRREWENVEAVVKEDGGRVGGKTQDESLIEPVNNVLMSLGAEPLKVKLIRSHLTIFSMDYKVEMR